MLRYGRRIAFGQSEQAEKLGRTFDGVGCDIVLPTRDATGVECKPLDHDEVYMAFFERSLCQAISRHLLDLSPVLTQVARSLLLGRKFGPDAAGLAAVSVCDLKEDRLITLYRSWSISRQAFGHGCSFMKLQQGMWGSATMRPSCGVTMSGLAWNKHGKPAP
jgi:hypothetical protein